LHEVQFMAREKVVLAYSGGLDTSVLVRILTDDYGLDVIAAHVDVGEAKSAEQLKSRAKKAGAVAFEFIEGKREYVTDFIFPALQANALYEGVYPLNAALSRAMIARHLVALAKKHGASAIAHGATGKGNDQVRFDLSSRALDPALKIIAPQRERYISRDFAIEYAKKHGIEVPATVEKPFSIDENLWGRSIEGGILEDPDTAPPESAFAWTRSVKDSPNSPTIVEIGFEAGLPVSLDGERLQPEILIAKMNTTAGENGVGRIDLMEDRVVGIKSRELYEAPAAITLIAARKDLERFTLPQDCNKLKSHLDQRYAEMVYEGFWFSPLRDGLDAFNSTLARSVEGTVQVKLHKGSMQVVARESRFGVYNRKLSTYGKEDLFDHRAAEGFISLLGMQLVEYRRLHPVPGNPQR
jgi:argininosuccinate synthase